MLSAVVITRDEERNILRCLNSLKFCDEIIVVDADSRDKTRQLATTITSKVFTRAWAGYADQKNYATNLAAGDWVLSLDADEEVSLPLQAEILTLLKSKPGQVAYTVPRRTLHSGKWIKHGGWYPNRLVRLFKKAEGKWVGSELHEFWESNGNVGQLQSDLVHHSFGSISDQVNRNNHYSTLGALALARKKQKFSRLKLVFKPASKFIETYWVKLGFLDGYLGFIISVSAAYSVFLKWAKLWELERDSREG